MLYLLSLVVGFILSVSIIIMALRKHGIAAFGLNPVIWFSIFFIILHLAMPAMKYLTSSYRYQLEYSHITMVLVTWCLILSYLLTAAFLSFATKHTIISASTTQPIDSLGKSRGRKNVTKLILFGLMIFVVGAYGAYNQWGHIGDDYLSDRIGAGVGRGFETQLPNFLLSAIVLFLYAMLERNKSSLNQRRVVFVFFSISMALAVLYYGSISSRNTIFIILILVLTIFSLMRQVTFRLTKTLVKRIFIIGIILCTVIMIILEITKTRHDGDSSYAQERRERLVFYMLDGAFGNDENILWLAQNPFEPQYGITYVAAITNFIPRSIWPEKPLGAGPRIRNIIYPGSYVVGQAGNSSITTGLYTEAYLNFGIIGLFFVPIIWASILVVLVRKVAKNLGSVKMVAWTTALVLWSTAFMYSEFLGFLGRFIFIMIPLFAVSVLADRRIYIGDRFIYRTGIR